VGGVRGAASAGAGAGAGTGASASLRRGSGTEVGEPRFPIAVDGETLEVAELLVRAVCAALAAAVDRLVVGSRRQ